MAELLKKHFLSEITPQLFADNTFMSRALNDDAFVNNNTVELPHSGTIPAVAVDRTTLPAAIAKRTDAPSNYSLSELTSDPTLIQDSEELIVAYNKRASVLKQHVDKINEKGADMLLNLWADGGETPEGAGLGIVTTGANRAATANGATGVRKAVTAKDILAGRAVMDRADIPQNGRVMVIPATMYNDLFEIDDFIDASKFGKAIQPEGFVGRIYGIDVYMRSKVNSFLGADYSLIAEGAAGAATHCHGILMWQEGQVRRAKGSTKVYMNVDEAAYYGSIFSAMCRLGGSPTRNDKKGIVSIVEAFVS